jgi:hypothetical protein
MTWWQILLLCWVCYLAGFATAALMAAARDNDHINEHNEDAIRAGLNDD